MLDIARLGIEIDTSDTKKGAADLSTFTVAGARAEQQTERLGQTAARTSPRMRGLSGGFRNLGMQLNQVAQVGGMTGNWMQAIAVQLPDMLLGFGSIGIAAGIAAGAMIPLISNLSGAREQALEYADAVDTARDVIDRLNSAQEQLNLTTDEAIAKYGEAARQVQGWAVNAAVLEVAQAGRRLQDSVGYAREAVGVYGEVVQVLGDISSTDASNALKAIREDFDVSALAAQELHREFLRLNDPSLTPTDMAGVLDNILKTLKDSGVELSTIPEPIQEMILEMIQFNTETAAAEVAIRNLRGAMVEASTGLPLFLQGFSPDELLPPGKIKPPPPPPPPPGRAAAPRVSEDARAAQRIYDQTRTAAERYAAELAEIDGLHEKGLLTMDTYNRAVEQAADKYDAAREGAGEWAEANELLRDSILQFALDGGDAMDSLANAIRRAAMEALLFGEGPLGGLLGGGGGLLGDLGDFLSFDGGGFTGGGARSGGVDGRGGFMAVLHPNETVIDHTKGQSAAGGGSITFAPVIDARGADAGAVARLEAAMQRAQVEFEGRVITAVTEAQRRRML